MLFFSLITKHGFNPLQTKRRPLCLKTQSVPRCKHFFFNPLKTNRRPLHLKLSPYRAVNPFSLTL